MHIESAHITSIIRHNIGEPAARPAVSRLDDFCRRIGDAIRRALDWIRELFGFKTESKPAADPVPQRLPSQRLFDFYTDAQPTDHGVHPWTIHYQSLDWLEKNHDYIQWAFPTFEPSRFNPTAPVLDQATLGRLKTDKSAKFYFRDITNKMLEEFYGFEWQISTARYDRGDNYFKTRALVWLTPGNHNFDRLTRIIKSLTLFGYEDKARALFQILRKIYKKEGDGIISDATFKHWEAACPKPIDKLAVPRDPLLEARSSGR